MVIECIQNRIALFTYFCLLLSFVGMTHAQDLIKSAPDMPTYKLGVVNQGHDNFGRPSVTIDYQRTKDGVGLAMLAGRTSDGPLRLAGFGFLHDASGKLELSELFSGNRLNAELYLVVLGTFAEECSFTCLVSNVVQVGNPSGSPVIAREWNQLESAAYKKDLVGRKPPLSLPTGFQLVRASTKLVPGMPIKVGRFGEWIDASLVAAGPSAPPAPRH